MQGALANPGFRYLFLSQVFSLLGTGLTTVALALLAFELGPLSAGAVLGSALAIKMVAYLTIAPVVGGLVHLLPRKTLLVSLDIVRGVLVLLLPFATEIWQLFVLVLILNACAAAFTPVFQASIPDLIQDEKDYTQALSLSRLAVELESLLSPTIAALLLGLLPYTSLFQLNGIGFVLSALLVLLSGLPKPQLTQRSKGIWYNISFGVRAYLATPRLRGLLALHLAVSAGGAMVIVNSVVYIKQYLALGDQALAQAMMATGAGAMLAALGLPKLLNYVHDRKVMLTGALLLPVTLLAGTLEPGFYGLLFLWFVIGLAMSLVLTPSGRILRLSCSPGDRSAFFSANFALSHGLWLFAYLWAGWMGATLGLSVTFAALAAVSLTAIVIASRLWPAQQASKLTHTHPELEHEHAHCHDIHHQHNHDGWEGPEPHIHPHKHQATKHKHEFIIDEHHQTWPK